jgi:hypothetical protein
MRWRKNGPRPGMKSAPNDSVTFTERYTPLTDVNSAGQKILRTGNDQAPRGHAKSPYLQRIPQTVQR